MKVKSILAIIILSLILAACNTNSDQLTQEFPHEGFSYAAGEINFPVTVNGVVIQVTGVNVFPGDADVHAGYVYVVPTISITNRSDEPVMTDQFSMRDEYFNEYQSWQTNVSFVDRLQGMPEFVDTNQTTTGQQVFLVPEPALRANMLVRWQSLTHESRIDVAVGELQFSGQ